MPLTSIELIDEDYSTMLDLKVSHTTIVDGTGRRPYVADIGVTDGRIVAIGPRLGNARIVIDGDGLTAAPGFIDVHTHYDAQVFWDPYCSPSALHGVTTVVGGNCGLTLAPVAAGDEEFLLGVLSRVESIPLSALRHGVDLRWRTFAELLDVMDAMPLGVNVGLLAGHTSMRRFVMGGRASTSVATDDELRTLEAELGQALEAGALGFSTSTAKAHVDLRGQPTPPHFADEREMIRLAVMCQGSPGTSLEFIPGSAQDGMSDEDVRLLQQMAEASGKSINWNLLQFSTSIPDLHERQLRASSVRGDNDRRGVLALMMPNNPRMRLDFGGNNVGLRLIPGFEWLFELPRGEFVAAVRSDAVRTKLHAHFAATSTRVAGLRSSMVTWRLVAPGSESLARHVGKTVRQIGLETGRGDLDTVLDLAVESGGNAAFERRIYEESEQLAATRLSMIGDPRVMLGGSDAGAHVDAMANGEYPTAAIDELVNQRAALPLEMLVHEMTDVPARMLGLTDRGRLAEGMIADLVLFEASRTRPGALVVRPDLPGGEARLFSPAEGVAHVFVGGVETIADGEFTGALPGRLLRSGRDTR